MWASVYYDQEADRHWKKKKRQSQTVVEIELIQKTVKPFPQSQHYTNNNWPSDLLHEAMSFELSFKWRDMLIELSKTPNGDLMETVL